MPHRMRFFFTSPAPALATLPLPPGLALRNLAPPFALLCTGETPLAELELNTPGDGTFDAEIAEYLEKVALGSGDKALVTATLGSCTAILCAQVLFHGRSTDDVLNDLDPFWDALDAAHQGLIQADGQGFYQGADFVLNIGRITPPAPASSRPAP
ncbi:hypothetical protein [Vannielia litorea]|uniref:Uncharacterized protein n=1 Tax=Vannielia litorea TaxID=1217970 RepID=A0A1N6FJ70_9RHOB|nr:hypothetical protein [Vannielia litorea]SIN95321.1 hypothetical protein SAMN05444002_1713 [Vannielia litorea]